MAEDHYMVWNKCLEYIRQEVSPQGFLTWFEPIVPTDFQDMVLTIQVPNKFSYEMLEEQYIDVLRKAIRKVIGSRAKLEYEIPVSHEIEKENADIATLDIDKIKNPYIVPGIKKVDFDSELNPRYTFDNFVEGAYNKLARNAGQTIAEKPGFNAFNPLFIFGNSALGKTHLAHAIGNSIAAKHPDHRVKYISCEKFTNQVVSAIKNKNLGDFSIFYQSLDTLILDDIQFLSGKVKTQEVFFFIFNELHQANKQLVMTCDRLPKDLEGMEERLISRFKWGLTAPLNQPDFETRKAILVRKAHDAKVELPENVIDYISYNLQNNIRELEGMLVSLSAHAVLNNTEINLPLAREVIQHFINNAGKELSVENIQSLVAEHLNIPKDNIKGSSRKRETVIGRQLAMYLCSNFTNNSLKLIGNKFGGKDHTTVIYSRKAIQNMIDTDSSFKHLVEDLEKKIRLNMVGA